MPVGPQLVGRPGSEAVLLQVATKFQATTNWHGRVPGAVVWPINIGLNKDEAGALRRRVIQTKKNGRDVRKVNLCKGE
jgi:hypothetical protein